MQSIFGLSVKKHREALDYVESIEPSIIEIATLFVKTLNNRGKIIFMGNGGSAADSQHLAAEFVGRFKKERNPLAAISLTTDTSIITAIGNDYGYDQIFIRQIQALAQSADLVVAISTSGNSSNVVTAVRKAKEMGVKTVGFLGKDGGKLKNLVDCQLTIPFSDTARVQEMHALVGHIICEIVDEHFAIPK